MKDAIIYAYIIFHIFSVLNTITFEGFVVELRKLKYVFVNDSVYLLVFYNISECTVIVRLDLYDDATSL